MSITLWNAFTYPCFAFSVGAGLGSFWCELPCHNLQEKDGP